jgi:hypothetical protein
MLASPLAAVTTRNSRFHLLTLSPVCGEFAIQPVEVSMSDDPVPTQVVAMKGIEKANYRHDVTIIAVSYLRLSCLFIRTSSRRRIHGSDDKREILAVEMKSRSAIRNTVFPNSLVLRKFRELKPQILAFSPDFGFLGCLHRRR